MSNYTEEFRVSNYDTKINCTSCGSDNVVHYGELWVNGHPTPKHKCNNCNLVFEKYEGGVANIVNSYQGRTVSGTQVSFTQGILSGSATASTSGMYGSNISAGIDSSNINYNYNGWGSYQQDSDIQQLKSKLNFLESNIYNMQNDMRTLLTNLIDMKNKYEKMLEDPLAHLKVGIRDFNLK